jgi:hypothetical protein
MSSRRKVPIVFQGIQPGDPSQDIDCAYFKRNPQTTEYTRALIPGETFEPMPAGTRVLVKRIGVAGRARAFLPPTGGLR